MAKVLHVGDICGIPHTLTAEMRRRGHHADTISFLRQYDILSRIKKFGKLCQVIPCYEVVWFHYSTGLPFGIDLLLWKLLNKKIVMYFHGDDIRGNHCFLQQLLADKVYVSTADLIKEC